MSRTTNFFYRTSYLMGNGIRVKASFAPTAQGAVYTIQIAGASGQYLAALRLIQKAVKCPAVTLDNLIHMATAVAHKVGLDQISNTDVLADVAPRVLAAAKPVFIRTAL